MNIQEIFSFRHYLLPVPKYYLNLDVADIEGEVWLPIKGFEGIYEISNLGRVKSLPKELINPRRDRKTSQKIRKQVFLKGYLRIGLSGNTKKNLMVLVHQCVASHFIENPLLKKEVNHIDGTKDINNVWNLEFNTHRENMFHALRTGLIKSTLSVLIVNSIRQEKFLSMKEISEKYKIHEVTITRILRGDISSYYDECIPPPVKQKIQKNSKFSIEQIRYMFELKANNMTYIQIGKEMKCRAETVSEILRKRRAFSNLY